MTAPAPAHEDQPLRPLLARIWRDYLSHHRGALFLSMLCAAAAGGLSALTLKLLEPAINGLFLQQNAPMTLWGFIDIAPGQALVVIPLAIVAVAVHRAILWRNGHIPFELYHRTDTRADSLLIGALLAHLWTRGLFPRRWLGPLAWVSLAFLGWTLIFLQPYDAALYEWSVFTVIGVAWAFVVLATVERAWSVNC